MKPIALISMLAIGAVAFGDASGESVAREPGEPTQQSKAAASSGNWVGKTAKGFALPSIDGKTIDVGKALGKQPVVLVFYRGVW